MRTSSHLFFITILYAFSGIVYFSIAIRGILRRNELKIFDLVRLMYSFVYGLMPFLLYFQESIGERNLYFYDYSKEGLYRLYLIWFLSVAAYGIMTLAYMSIRNKNQNDIGRIDPELNDRSDIVTRLFVCGIMSLIIGYISLFLWTAAYGSLSEFIRNAQRIRSGKGLIYNRFAFVKQFVKILPLSLYSLLSAYLFEHPRGFKKIIYIALLALSFIGNYYYFIASDARVTILFTGLAVLSISLRHRKKHNLGRYLVIAALFGFVILEATMLADSFTYFVRHGEWRTVNAGFIDNLNIEFRFSLSSEMKAIKAWLAGDLKPQIINDLINSVTGWIPDRFLPFKVPDTLWRYNTKMYGEYTGATSPTSLVATSIYEFGLAGVIIFPLCFGFLIGIIEKLLWSNRNVVYADVYYGVLVGISIQMVSHNQISTFVVSLFPAFLFWLVSKGVNLCVNVGKNRKIKKAAAEEALAGSASTLKPSDKPDKKNSSGKTSFDDPEVNRE